MSSFGHGHVHFCETREWLGAGQVGVVFQRFPFCFCFRTHNYFLFDVFDVHVRSVARYGMLALTADGDAKKFKILCASLDIVKLLHVGFTAVAVKWLLRPKRLAVLTMAMIVAFGTMMAMLWSRQPFAILGLAATLLTVTLQAGDAAMDALFAEQKPYVLSFASHDASHHMMHDA